jgi:ribosomal protein S9
MLGLVDIDVSVSGSGPSAQAGAIRYATSMCLRYVISITNRMILDAFACIDLFNCSYLLF